MRELFIVFLLGTMVYTIGFSIKPLVQKLHEANLQHHEELIRLAD